MFSRSHYILAAVLFCITALFGFRFLQTANHEFLIYVGIVLAVSVFIAATFRRVRYPFVCLIGLAVWAVLHLAGGGIRIGNDILYGLILFPLSADYPVLRYDQVVHAWGFGVCTLIMYHLLANLLPQNDLRRFSMGLLVITSGMGFGAFNENVEFVLTVLLPQTGVGGYVNTSLDLCANFAGAVIAYLLVYFNFIRMESPENSFSEISLPEQAVGFYSQKPKQYNCAQAVAKTFKRDDLAESLKSCGGGNAPDGLCGALYAAILLAGEEQTESVKEQFLKVIGHLHCKAIRKEGKTSCADCVRRAAEIAEQSGFCLR
ncbi:MAG: C-GCAxxG-C-C family protein [Planctomycetaceae bacterium]|nr:C-GCAxxG-C-C family protein [Planctomycetaceae bacterium]